MSTSAMEPTPPTPEQLAAWAEAEAAAERELAEADAAAAAAAAAGVVAPVAAPTRPARRRIPTPLLFALPVLLAVAAGVASALFAPHKEEPKAEHHDGPHVVVPVPPTPGDVEAIDTLIRAGCFGEALPLCKADPALPPAARRTLAYREAVCLEALGRLKDANGAYKKAEAAEGNQAAWARAVLGRVRCAAAADDVAGAQALLDRVVLRSGHPDCTGSHVFEECLFMRARLDALRAGPVRAMDPFDPDAVAWPALTGTLDKYFEWLPPDTLAATSVGIPAGPNVLELRRSPEVPGGFEVVAHCAERPFSDTIAALAALAGLKVQMDATVTAALAKEVVALEVEGLPLGDVLDALGGRAGAGWKIADGKLEVGSGIAIPSNGDATARAFARAHAAAPGHPRAVSVRLWLANFDFAAGRNREAAKEYQTVLAEKPNAPEIPHAVLNLGLTELRTGLLQSARSRFVDLVDRAPRSRWSEYGWWWVGRTHLDVGDSAAAKKAFQEIHRGRTREVASAAAIGICWCELFDGKDEPARAALDESRGASREEHMALRTALETLLRYRAIPTPGRRKLVLDALREAFDGRGLGPAGTYLVGRVYRDLGMPEKATAMFDAATDSIRGPLAARMTFDAAEWYDLLDRQDAARSRYLAVAATDPKGLGPKAELKLAGISLRSGNPDDCIRRCHALADRPGVERSDVLALLGRGYEARRNYRKAAECFAGHFPEE